MKAITYTKFGPPEVLQFAEFEKPVPEKNEILVKILATSVTTGDCNLRGLTYIPPGLGLLAKFMLGFNKPKIKIPGGVFAGEVEAVGSDVKLFEKGDKVFGSDGNKLSTYAEFKCVSETGTVTKMTDNLDFGEAAVIPFGALTALYFLKDKAKIKSGQKVLVVGASGGTGSAAVQIAKYFGAEVTGVCSTRNLELVKSLGADKVIDYTKKDFTNLDEKFDIIFVSAIGKTSFSNCKKMLKPNGYYLAVSGGLRDLIDMIKTSLIGNKKVVFGGGIACEKKENLVFIKELIEQEKFKPVLDKTFSFNEMVQAHKYFESADRKGNVAILLKH